jgi:hypothetical protein
VKHVEVATELPTGGTYATHRPRKVDDVLREAERSGIDLSREFRARFHLPQGYAEFWQDEEPVRLLGESAA